MKKLIDLHYEWEKQKLIPSLGLCCSLPGKYQETLELFEPSTIELKSLSMDGENIVFWGSGLPRFDLRRGHAYTLRRQYIVLFICAIHGEI